MQVITNAIDADKLDYMFRDSHATGVPIGIDLERMLYKLFCVEVEGEAVPSGLQQLFGSDERALVLATDLPGHQLAYDLEAARSILFERIYLHHKTRASERLVLDYLARHPAHPTELLGADDGLIGSYSPNPRDSAVVALRDRLLPRRAFAMSKQYLLSVATPDDNGKPRVEPHVEAAWEDLLEDLADYRQRHDLREQIGRKLDVLRDLLGIEQTDVQLWLEPLPKPYDLGAAQLVVRRPDGTVGVEPAFPAKAASYTLNPSDTVFVYTTALGDDFNLLHIASETVIAERYGLVLGRDVADHAKVDASEIERVKHQLERSDASVFDIDGRLRPTSEVTRTIEGSRRVRALTERFAVYQPGNSPDKRA